MSERAPLLKSQRSLDHELVNQGHMACPGCGAVLAMRYVLNVLGPKTIVVLPACCWSVISGRHPASALNVPLFHTAFETAAAVATGVRGALDARGDSETHVLAWAGDGGTFDIGLQALSGAAERNEDIIYVCYDNEAYMNTGVQRSSSTPPGAWTTTTPAAQPEDRDKKDIMGIMAAHRIPYAATAAIAYPDDLMAKVKKARDTRGMRFLHIFCPCPTGWRTPPDMTVELARAAVQARVFPLYEVENGETWSLTLEPEGRPIADYIRAQGRFAHVDDQTIAQYQSATDRRWDQLMKRMAQGC
jgi:pyruvate/2-oxoacid:ferredoxin oxidoreductase beta subunit